MKKLVAVGLLMCMPVVGCKTTKSGESEIASSSQPLAGADETGSDGSQEPSILEIYRGTENNEVCELTIKKNVKNEVISVKYRSAGLLSATSSRKKEFEISFSKQFGISLTPGPSLQFPGYTRIAMSHGVFPDVRALGGLAMWDQFILVKDNLRTAKVIDRVVQTAPVVPVPTQSSSETSDCVDMTKV